MTNCVGDPRQRRRHKAPLGDEVPYVDMPAAGLLTCAHETEAIVVVGAGSANVAIHGSLRLGPGQRHRQVFDLARALKARPELADAAISDLKVYVRYWHRLAKKVIRTKPFEETWIDFCNAWPRVKFAKGDEPMAQMLAKAKDAPLPIEAQRYEQASLRLLVKLCRELQRAAGDGPFFLSCAA